FLISSPPPLIVERIVVPDPPSTFSERPLLLIAPPNVSGPAAAFQVCTSPRIIGVLIVSRFGLLLTIPPLLRVKGAPLMVNGSAVSPNESEAMLQGKSTVGVSRRRPANVISAVPSLTGPVSVRTQFAAVLQLLSSPSPLQLNACGPARQRPAK